jgi:hypothetical protein
VSASRLHQTIAEMIRSKPALGLVLLDAVGVDVPANATADGIGEALSPVVSDYRPDSVVAVRADRERIEHVLVVEIQLRRDPEKELSLPAYQALVRARHRAPCIVLVVTPVGRVAAWLRRPIHLGGGSIFQALVVGPAELGRLRRRERHQSLRAELAFLRAIARGERDPSVVLKAARVFDDLLPEERGALYFDVILDALPASARRRLEIVMQKEQLKFRSEFMRGLVKEGLQKGRTEGRAEGLRDGIRAVLAARDVTLTKKDERALDECDEVSVLEEWARRAARATTAADVFEPKKPGKPRSPRSRAK